MNYKPSWEENSLSRPMAWVLAVYVCCYAFRAIEYFVIRTDKTFWGEAFLHKLAGILILWTAARLLASRHGLRDVGFGGSNRIKHLLWGLGFGLAVFALAYGVEAAVALSQGSFEGLRLYVSSYAVDGNLGNRTGAVFFIICMAGNVINVVMEEGVFRGLFPRILEGKYSFLASAAIASSLFGLWHVIGPVRNYADGLSSAGGMAANILMLVVTTGLGGFKFALLTRLTGSLYMAMGDHFVNNTIVNVLHVSSQGGDDGLMFLRMAVAQTLSFVAVLCWYVKARGQRL